METDYILHLWLVEVPEHTANFVRLSIIGTMMMSFGNTGYTACMATGKIKRYSLWITLTGCTVFPLTWIAFLIGMPVETAYVIFILVYFVVDLVRLWIMKYLLDFPVMMFIKDVFGRIVPTTFLAIVFPLIVVVYVDEGLVRFFISCTVCLLSTFFACFVLGISKQERKMILNVIKSKIRG
jgi:hypothetical protein